MKKLLLFLTLLSPLFAYADGSQVTIFTAAASNASVNLIGSGVGYYLLSWNISGGTASACTIAIDSSADNSSFSAGAILAGTTCTSNGRSTIVGPFTVNYIRSNLTAFTASGGTPVLTTTLFECTLSTCLIASGTTFTGGTLSSIVNWTTGLGAINHITGPTDQPLSLSSPSTNALQLRTSGALRWSIGSGGSLQAQGAGIHLNIFSANADIAGVCTMVAGTCNTITFTTAYTSVPSCVATWNGTGTLTGIVKALPTTGNLIVSSSVGTDTAVMSYHCIGNPT